MSKQANRKAIGAFVVVALALAVAAIFVFGSGKFFEKRDYVVAYFQGSVKGLKVGAPVVFRGVTIGQVIKMAIYADRRDLSYQIPVVLQIDRDSFRAIGPDIKDRKQYFQDLIKKGLRAQLQLQSIVTGQLMVNIDFFPNTEVKLVGGKMVAIPKDMVEIPTIQTPLQKIQQTLEDLPIGDLAKSMEKSLRGIENLVTSEELKKSLVYFKQTTKDIRDLVRHVDAKIDPLSADVGQTLKDVQNLIRSINSQVDPLAASVKQTSDTAGAALKDARKLLNNVDKQVQPLGGDLDRTLKAANGALKKAEETLANVNGVIGEGSPLRFQLETTFNELAQAARSIRVLAEYLQRNPDALLRGKSGTGAY
jgi:paraquat-inducible protein B